MTARRIGLWSGAALVVANMIGAGVFTSSGYALLDLGSRHYVMLAWGVSGIVALCGALSYGGLVRCMPGSGGEYHYLKEALHPLLGFLAGWVSLLAGFTAPIAFAALALASYAGLSSGSYAARGVATLAIGLAFLMHAARGRRGVVVQNAVVLIKLLLLAAFFAMAWVKMPASPPPAVAAEFDVGRFAVALVWMSLAYSGWNATAYVAGEVDEPRSAMRSLWMGCLLVTVVYVALNYVFLYSVPKERIAGQEDVAAIAADGLGGGGFATFVRVVIGVALFTSVSAMMMAGPRVYARMAADGLFPRVFRVSGDVPVVAVAGQGGLAVLLVWVTELRQLLSYIPFMLSLSSALAVVGLLVLRWRRGAAAVPIPGYPIAPFVYVGMTLWAAVFLIEREPQEAGWGLVTVAVGVPLYFVFRSRAVRCDVHDM